MRETGADNQTVLAELDTARAREPDVHGAHLFGLVYPSARVDVEDLAHEVADRYLFSNALNPFRFPEQARLMEEVVTDVGALVHLPAGGGGSTTSGGTESILMAMLVHRERARARGVERPTIVAGVSAHPAYAKAAHLLGMELVQVPLDQAWRTDVTAARELIDDRTAVVVASAFSYPHGVMDPVADLAALAAEAGAGCHVDACIGGFVLPFLERLGRPVPPWDFRVPGVTSMSADVHKYGYVPKGASVVLHRTADWAGLQWFVYDQWPAGLYGSPGVAGARSPAAVLTAWAVIRHLGRAGYTQLMADLMAGVDRFRAEVDAIMGLAMVGDPIGPVLALTTPGASAAAVAEAMTERGWYLNRVTDPDGLHLMLSPAHLPLLDALLTDLAQCRAAAPPSPTADQPVRYA